MHLERSVERSSTEAHRNAHAGHRAWFGSGAPGSCGKRPTFREGFPSDPAPLRAASPPYYQLVGRRDLIGRPVRGALPEMVEQRFIELLDEVYGTAESFVGT